MLCCSLRCQLGLTDLPATLPDVSTLTKEANKELLTKLHEVLVEVSNQHSATQHELSHSGDHASAHSSRAPFHTAPLYYGQCGFHALLVSKLGKILNQPRSDSRSTTAPAEHPPIAFSVVCRSLHAHRDLLLLLCVSLIFPQTHVQEGALTCGKCGRAYPIQQGIPNMRLNEDEVQ